MNRLHHGHEFRDILIGKEEELWNVWFWILWNIESIGRPC